MSGLWPFIGKLVYKSTRKLQSNRNTVPAIYNLLVTALHEFKQSEPTDEIQLCMFGTYVETQTIMNRL